MHRSQFDQFAEVKVPLRLVVIDSPDEIRQGRPIRVEVGLDALKFTEVICGWITREREAKDEQTED
jgi:hypothetical protein